MNSGWQAPLHFASNGSKTNGSLPSPPDNSGSHRNKPSSVYSLIYTLIPALITAALLISLFLVLRPKLRRLYSPRTFIDVLTDDEKTPRDPGTVFGWIKKFAQFSDWQILNSQSLDAYLYVRFLKVIIAVCFVGTVITGAVLLPINATGGGGQKQLDMLSFSNIVDPNRYYAHALVAWFFFGFVLFMITRETVYLIHLRQAYLLSPWNSSRISSRTVLFTSVPNHYCSVDRLKSLFDEVKQVWLVQDFKKLEKLIEKMDEAALKLEAAEIKLIRDANAKRLKGSKPGSDDEDTDFWLTIARRPKHKRETYKFIFGNSVDTIEESRDRLNHLIPAVRAEQKLRLDGDAKLLGSVFIEFETQAAAQAAYSLVAFNHPYRIVPRQVGVLPDEVIWPNLRMSDWEALARKLLVFAFVAALTIFWGIPVAFVGTISNLNYLSQKFKWLRWLENLNKKQLGLLTGLLPSVLLSALQALVPKVLRYLSRESGAVTQSHAEVRTQKFFFAFSLIQIFLVTTFSSGATAVIGQLAREPSSAPALLAENLPKASNFYISYLVLYGVAISSQTVFNILGLFFEVLLPKVWPYSSPRDAFIAYTTLSSPGYGSECAKWTNLAVIAISYSCVAPLVLAFATVGFSFIYLAYRYNYFYVYNTSIDTKGVFYATALQQMTVGVYIAELCLIGLFSTRINSAATANGPLLLMIILFISTVLYQYLMHQTLKPLTELLPRNLLSESEREYEDFEASHENQPLLSPAPETNDQPAAGDINAHHSGGTHPTATTTPARLNAITAYQAKVDQDRAHWLRRLFTTRTASAATISQSLHPSLKTPVPEYPQNVARKAFLNPAIAREPPVLWIVKDEMGISAREVQETKAEVEGLEISDRGAWLDKKNRVRWDEDRLREMPLWKGRVIY
ncbi:hypothetical protein IWX90DRAFT_427419 [Phyllosticta citrichinensis]|uniref:DUF221-domain-containing protein n=1 Tax=Phyllosticta citrichinensis TaxID=1130410 RepID=A0ABR1XZF5_9PEZI